MATDPWRCRVVVVRYTMKNNLKIWIIVLVAIIILHQRDVSKRGIGLAGHYNLIPSDNTEFQVHMGLPPIGGISEAKIFIDLNINGTWTNYEELDVTMDIERGCDEDFTHGCNNTFPISFTAPSIAGEYRAILNVWDDTMTQQYSETTYFNVDMPNCPKGHCNSNLMNTMPHGTIHVEYCYTFPLTGTCDWDTLTTQYLIDCDEDYVVEGTDTRNMKSIIPLLCVPYVPPQTDTDNDGTIDHYDNCPSDANPNQEDRDGDSIGDVCDTCPDDYNNDADADSFCADVDNCPDVDNFDQNDTDSDGVGDVCDNCMFESNSDQMNSDKDTIGDVCDNCWFAENEDQDDTDNDCPSIPFTFNPICGDACQIDSGLDPLSITCYDDDSSVGDVEIQSATIGYVNFSNSINLDVCIDDDTVSEQYCENSTHYNRSIDCNSFGADFVCGSGKCYKYIPAGNGNGVSGGTNGDGSTSDDTYEDTVGGGIKIGSFMPFIFLFFGLFLIKVIGGRV